MQPFVVFVNSSSQLCECRGDVIGEVNIDRAVGFSGGDGNKMGFVNMQPIIEVLCMFVVTQDTYNVTGVVWRISGLFPLSVIDPIAKSSRLLMSPWSLLQAWCRYPASILTLKSETKINPTQG